MSTKKTKKPKATKATPGEWVSPKGRKWFTPKGGEKFTEITLRINPRQWGYLVEAAVTLECTVDAALINLTQSDHFIDAFDEWMNDLRGF